MKDCLCADCNIETVKTPSNKNYYMVTNKLWKSVGMGKGFLCIDCLEKRLSRSLTLSDFMEAPINYLNPVFITLKERYYDQHPEEV